MTSGPHRRWWERGVLYQVYPRSFQDADGDGIGDLRGIESRLGHLVWLGVDAVWLSPIFRSPMRDFGYDVSDYLDVDPVFGTLGDLDRLISAAHRRDLRVLLDFVPNHTSSDHPWFVESRSSRTNPKRDWYTWRDPAPGGGPPNNWTAVFGGGRESAWRFDERTGQYYLRMFLAEQPDLNWTNPDVREAMHDVLRFWFRRGVDGFRVDVIHMIAKDPDLRDEEPNPAWRPGMPDSQRLRWQRRVDGPGIGALLAGLRSVADEFGDRLLVGETHLPLERLLAYYGHADQPGIHLPFNFQLLLTPWEPAEIGPWIARYEAGLPADAWPSWVLGNHDTSRVATRLGQAQARVAAMLLLTLRGTPTLYAGDEIGREDVPIPPDRIVDVDGRDPERAPIPWEPGETGGFSTGVPWLPIGDTTVNVAVQRGDPRSMLTLHRRLLELRRREGALAIGSWTALPAPDGVLAYAREADGRRLAVALNFRSEPRAVELADGPWSVLLSTHLDRDGASAGAAVELRPDEGIVVGPS